MKTSKHHYQKKKKKKEKERVFEIKPSTMRMCGYVGSVLTCTASASRRRTILLEQQQLGRSSVRTYVYAPCCKAVVVVDIQLTLLRIRLSSFERTRLKVWRMKNNEVEQPAKLLLLRSPYTSSIGVGAYVCKGAIVLVRSAVRKHADIAFHMNMYKPCLLYTSPSPRDRQKSRMPSSA